LCEAVRDPPADCLLSFQLTFSHRCPQTRIVLIVAGAGAVKKKMLAKA
jgi:hypothetical protein